MDFEPWRGVREGPIGRRVVVVAATSLAAVLAVVALMVALAPPRPPGTLLSGTTWEWTGATTGPGVAPVVVPDPSRYTIVFLADLTFRANADCVQVSGTYTQIFPGRTGLPTTGLRIRPESSSPASCGPGSLADAFLRGLRSAAAYQIVDAELRITNAPQGTMTFEVGGPAAIAPVAPGG